MSEARTKPRYIILGSGIAGMAAAEEIRARDAAAQIVMVSAERQLCPNRPMLIEEFALDGSGAALFEKQQDWPARFDVEMYLGCIAESIDLAAKTVTVRRLPAAGEMQSDAAPDDADLIANDAAQTLPYDKLIYALGAEVTIPPIPGAELEHVHVVRTREDMAGIRQHIRRLCEATATGGPQSGQPRASKSSGGNPDAGSSAQAPKRERLGQTIGNAVVIGGGMLGLEDAWGLHEQRLAVSIIEQKQRVAFGQIDQSAGNLMKKRIERYGIPVYVNAQVTEIGDGYVTFRQPAAEDSTASMGPTGGENRRGAGMGEADGQTMPERAETEPAETGSCVTREDITGNAADAENAGCPSCPGCGGCPAQSLDMELVTIPADLVILSTGVTPNSTLGAEAGLATAGAWIAVDEHCRTSDPGVYAAGDCAALNGRNDAVWEEARQMGRVAGANAAADCLREHGSTDKAVRTERAVTESQAPFGPVRDDAPDPNAPTYRTYAPVIQEHVFTGFDTEIYTLADSSGAGTDGVYIRHADVEIFDYQRERYIRVSLQDDRIAGVLLINAAELAPELTEAFQDGAGEEEARRIVKAWIDSHDVDFKPAAPFRKR